MSVLFHIGSLDGGGAERQVVAILKRLNRQEFLPQLSLTYRRGTLLSEVPLDVPIYSCYAPQGLTPFERGLMRLRLAFLQRNQRLQNIINRLSPNLVYSRTYLASCDAARACRATKTPHVIACVADPETELQLHGGVFQPWYWKLARQNYLEAALVLANSQGLADRLIEFFQLPQKHVQLQPNLFDTTTIEAKSTEFDPQFEPSKLHFVTVGRIDENKGQRQVLEALAHWQQQNPQVEWIWHLLGEGPMQTELQQLAVRLNLDQHLVWHGFVPNPYPYMRNANLLILPSRTEGSPNVLVEAMLVALPIISTNCPSGPAEILQNGKWGELVPVGSSRHMSQAIQRFLENRGAWKSRAIESQSYARKFYDPDAVLQQLEIHFRSIIHRKR